MSYSDFFIIGNGFDLAHGMPTRYGDFREWLLKNDRIDVIEELQNAYPVKIKEGYLLWSEFEKALGEYDIDIVVEWNWENLFLTETSHGNLLYNNGLIETRLPDIIYEAFTRWVCSIPIATTKSYDFLSKDSLYLTFNYTDTLESLYQIPEGNVIHIHGRAYKGEKLIVGHNRMIDPSEFWYDSIDMRENNERMQRLTVMNDLCKPVFDLIERYDYFFKNLDLVKDIYIIGHSCEEIDYPYFVKIKESVPIDSTWHFNPHTSKDTMRIEKLIQTTGITNYIFSKKCLPKN